MVDRERIRSVIADVYMRIVFVVFFIFFHTYCTATEYQPWIDNLYEFEFRSSLFYQGYSKVSQDSRLTSYENNDCFLRGSLYGTKPDLGGELEFVQARTRKQRGTLDHAKLTGRYFWLDDVAGDDWSVATGFGYTQALKSSLNDVSSFHHGLYEGEIFLSIGKETALLEQMSSRWWAVLGVGVAEQGAPWMRMHLDYERVWLHKNRVKVFLRSLWGLGSKNLCIKDFHGYGLIGHTSIDLGFRYQYDISYFGRLSVEYSYRVYAKNFPAYVNCLKAELLYTFGL